MPTVAIFRSPYTYSVILVLVVRWQAHTLLNRPDYGSRGLWLLLYPLHLTQCSKFTRPYQGSDDEIQHLILSRFIHAIQVPLKHAYVNTASIIDMRLESLHWEYSGLSHVSNITMSWFVYFFTNFSARVRIRPKQKWFDWRNIKKRLRVGRSDIFLIFLFYFIF